MVRLLLWAIDALPQTASRQHADNTVSTDNVVVTKPSVIFLAVTYCSINQSIVIELESVMPPQRVGNAGTTNAS